MNFKKNERNLITDFIPSKYNIQPIKILNLIRKLSIK